MIKTANLLECLISKTQSIVENFESVENPTTIRKFKKIYKSFLKSVRQKHFQKYKMTDIDKVRNIFEQDMVL